MEITVAYFDCFSGASGDMLLGALLDAGLDLEQLKVDLGELGLTNYELTLTPQVRHGIRGVKFDVLDHGHDRPARNLSAIRDLLEKSALPPQVREPGLLVFQRLAEAEAGVHGTSVDEVHFHELGALDTVIDVVGFCYGVYRLGIAAIYSSPLPLGSGTIKTAHGLLPVPAPATLALLTAARAPVTPFDAEGELVTPTGAALLSTLASFSRPPMRIQQVGYGFGTKEFAWANLVRVWIGESLEEAERTPSRSHQHGHAHGETHEH